MTGRRVTSISLPHFAIERWQQMQHRMGDAPPDDLPVVLSREGAHGPVIHAANRAARIAGIAEGARVVDMRAIFPDLRVEYADLRGEAQAFERLALWSRRWCPWTAVDGADGLILDTTGSDHLWGGEEAMLVEIETRLSRLGLTARAAVAPTWGAAWALARHGSGRAICAADGVADALRPLPAQALRLEAETLLLLTRLGLKTVGSLMQVPRAALARRFGRNGTRCNETGSNPLTRLDQATGHLAEPVSSSDAPPHFEARVSLPEPIQDPTAHLPGLCAALCEQFERERKGGRRLRLTVYRTDGEISRVEVATSAPSRDARHLERLFDGRLERINPGFGFDLITLEAGAVETIDPLQDLLEGRAEEDLHLPRLIDRLTARFGAPAVKRPVLLESHMPERAEAWLPALAGTGGMPSPASPVSANPDPANPDPACRPRPIRLLDPAEEVRVLYAVPEGPPAQFIWRRQTHRVARFEGPERIAPEWWKDRPGTRLRDYFRIEDQTGRRFWLYREGLHEDGRGGDPRWFLHGMFA